MSFLFGFMSCFCMMTAILAGLIYAGSHDDPPPDPWED